MCLMLTHGGTSVVPAKKVGGGQRQVCSAACSSPGQAVQRAPVGKVGHQCRWVQGVAWKEAAQAQEDLRGAHGAG